MRKALGGTEASRGPSDDESREVMDLRGLRCPLPALKTAARLKVLAAGASLDVLADDPLARLDIAHLCGKEGHTLLAVEEADGYLRFLIRRGAG